MAQQADYAAIKTGFMTKARTLTEFFVHPYQVTDDDADVNRGAIYYMICRPGAVPIGYVPRLETKKLYNVNWNIVFDLQHRYKSFKESWQHFADLRDAVLNKFVFTIDKSLPGTIGIWDVTITAPEPPGQKPPEGAPTWIGQTLIAVISQRIDVTA